MARCVKVVVLVFGVVSTTLLGNDVVVKASALCVIGLGVGATTVALTTVVVASNLLVVGAPHVTGRLGNSVVVSTLLCGAVMSGAATSTGDPSSLARRL